MFQNARTLVFADGVNLTDLLFNRWNGSPKWQMISPDEVHSVEVYYGPYSAQYSGNSMNGVVNYFTKLPNEKTNVIRASYFFLRVTRRIIPKTNSMVTRVLLHSEIVLENSVTMGFTKDSKTIRNRRAL